MIKSFHNLNVFKLAYATAMNVFNIQKPFQKKKNIH
jgi:hypothetical protein